MMKPIKNWFFELIEDAIGSKAMKQFKKEEENRVLDHNELKQEK